MLNYTHEAALGAAFPLNFLSFFRLSKFFLLSFFRFSCAKKRGEVGAGIQSTFTKHKIRNWMFAVSVNWSGALAMQCLLFGADRNSELCAGWLAKSLFFIGVLLKLRAAFLLFFLALACYERRSMNVISVKQFFLFSSSLQVCRLHWRLRDQDFEISYWQL